jgi:hypothetical protein
LAISIGRRINFVPRKKEPKFLEWLPFLANDLVMFMDFNLPALALEHQKGLSAGKRIPAEFLRVPDAIQEKRMLFVSEGLEVVK